MSAVGVEPARIPTKVREVCRVLESHGEKAWIVGGCLRDLLLGREVSDWDFATTARPERVVAIFPRTVPTGIKHGTVTVLSKGSAYEVTTLRGEGAYTDGRRPDEVFYVDRIEDDLGRRDFTVNALALDPLTGNLVDPFGGLADLEARILRAVGDPASRFSEDGLRILRGARFVATLGFSLEPATEAAFRPSLDVFRKVSRERVHDEWVKTMKADRPSPAFDVMRRTGILAITFPELAALPADDRAFGFPLALAALDAADGDAKTRHAALFAPLGRPATSSFEASVAAAGKAAERIDTFLREYRYSNEERASITHAVRHQHHGYSSDWPDADVRRFVQRVGLEHLDRLFAVLDALDAAGADVGNHRELRRRITEQRRLGMVVTAKDLALSGAELLTGLGWTPGPRIGALQRRLLERVTDDPSLNEAASLLAEARRLADEIPDERGRR